MENNTKFQFVFKTPQLEHGDNSTGNQLVLAQVPLHDSTSLTIYLMWLLYVALGIALLFACKWAYKTFMARNSITLNFISSSDMALHSTASNRNRFRHFFSSSKRDGQKNRVLGDSIPAESKNSVILSVSGACTNDPIIHVSCSGVDTLENNQCKRHYGGIVGPTTIVSPIKKSCDYKSHSMYELPPAYKEKTELSEYDTDSDSKDETTAPDNATKEKSG